MAINLSRVNLNLLVALDVLLKEQNVTRAGERLFITQSAMSNSLKQLREVFDNELFVRGKASKMMPTDFALSLRAPLLAFLETAQVLYSTSHDFEPALSDRVFRIGMSDYSEVVLLPKLIEYLGQHAPNIELQIKHMNNVMNDESFELGSVDMAVGIYQEIPKQLSSKVLFTDRLTVVGNASNPVMKAPMTLEVFASHPQIVVVMHNDRSYFPLDQAITKAGYKRKVLAEVSHVMPALFAVGNSKSQVISTIANRIINSIFVERKFVTQPVPIEMPPKIISQVWHKRTETDAAHMWLRGVVQGLIKD